MGRLRTRCLMVPLIVLSTAASACSNDSTTASSSSTSSVVTTTAAPSTTAAPAPTAAPRQPATFASPTAAAKVLFEIWTTSNRAAADTLALAPPDELGKLFAHKALPAAKLRTCDDGAFGPATCFFGNGQGGVSITLTHAGDAWTILTIDAY